MTDMSQHDPLSRLATMHKSVPSDAFDLLRPRLFGIAYRMLSLRADAEDVLQDAWLRWEQADHAHIQCAEAWLVSVVTRLAIDRLRAAKIEREAYAGAWLPEPIVEWHDETPEAIVERANDLSIAFLHMLERLGPEERAAFLLRQAFDYDYAEIAAMLGKTQAGVRQTIHRARERLLLERPRFQVPTETHRKLLQRFVEAAAGGKRSDILALMSDEVTCIGDGGGKVPTIAAGSKGADRVTNLFWAHFLRLGTRLEYRIASVNGEPGLLRYIDGVLESAQAVVTDSQRIVAIYVVRNPEKLARIAQVQTH
jgi:RNA polymerase sigma-70 factor, ECF subfamily